MHCRRGGSVAQLSQKRRPAAAACRLLVAQRLPAPEQVGGAIARAEGEGERQPEQDAMRCETCHDEKLVAFSCKGRRICPSCGARCIAERAALSVDDILPARPFRPWC